MDCSSSAGCRNSRTKEAAMRRNAMSPDRSASGSKALMVSSAGWRSIVGGLGDVAAELWVALGLVVSAPEVGISLGGTSEVNESKLFPPGQVRGQCGEGVGEYGDHAADLFAVVHSQQRCALPPAHLPPPAASAPVPRLPLPCP